MGEEACVWVVPEGGGDSPGVTEWVTDVCECILCVFYTCACVCVVGRLDIQARQRPPLPSPGPPRFDRLLTPPGH